MLSSLTYSLVLIAISFALAHDSLIAQSKPINSLINTFAGGISPVGILLFTVLQFTTPAIPLTLIVNAIMQSLTEKVDLLGAQVNVVIFASGLLLFVVISVPIIYWATIDPSNN
ncbi:hypothetical protein GCM10009000_102600 [Halobacterium noricense]